MVKWVQPILTKLMELMERKVRIADRSRCYLDGDPSVSLLNASELIVSIKVTFPWISRVFGVLRADYLLLTAELRAPVLEPLRFIKRFEPNVVC